jgi:putative ATPase
MDFMAFTPTLAGAPPASLVPLAQRMRPRSLDEIVGQDRLVGDGSLLRQALEAGQVHSMILWGPPGCGKTTLALLMSDYANAHFEALSAVLSGIADVRKALAAARARFDEGTRTVLFVDEVHRFNKTQQDAFLPDIESGAIVFVGATTENPSFELNSALLSRCRVHVLDAVSPEAIEHALQAALEDDERGMGGKGVELAPGALSTVAHAADGDVRRALTFLEIAASLSRGKPIDESILAQVLADRIRRFDKGGEHFYDQISALHKSVRSSDPDAALYWFGRMMDGGVDSSYLARRLLRMAVEDVGLADNQAQRIALEAWDSYERLGSPEGDLALAQVAVYLALVPKSNAIYAGYNQVREDINRTGTLPVPLHLRSLSSKLLKTMGYGAGYQYDHDVSGGVAMDQVLLPDVLLGREYYRPLEKGLEANIKKYLTKFRQDRAAARRKD